MPDHIPVGELDGNGHLPDIHRLMGILGEALESYALVLVDIPPVLASVDAEYLARRADCVVLVAEARHVTSLELKRVAGALERIQPKAVACVLNRVHAADGRGFAQDARREFETGAPKPIPAWQQP
jgi:Mrp family chromosome partitioning ATPase